MSDTGLPFNPLRTTLYTPEELFEGFSAGNPESYAACADIAILSYFWRFGKNPSTNKGASTLEALHDNSISEAAQALLGLHSAVVAVMGGHGMVRGTKPYVDIAYLAFQLSAQGVLVASGGGPGAMEATHLGAFLSTGGLSGLNKAISRLSAEPTLPQDAKNLVGPSGQVDAAIARQLHKWIAPAMAIVADTSTSDRRDSLGVPTWLYGYEPTTPFATHSAKYFQNSLREDGLVTLGSRGIVFAEGSAGTVQEIFQDAAQNYYGEARPMVFLGTSYWEKTLPVRPLVETLLGKKTRLLFTDSWSAAVEFLLAG